MKSAPRYLRLAGLLVAAAVLPSAAIFTIGIAVNLITPPVSEYWLVIPRNVGYSIIAGSVLLFLVGIYHQSETLLQRGERGDAGGAPEDTP